MTQNVLRVEWVDPDKLATVVNGGMDRVLVIDSRSFLEYNTCHVLNSVNVVCSKLVKRRLQQDKLSVKDFLANTCRVDADSTYEIIVYDQGTHGIGELSPDCFVHILLNKLAGAFKSVSLLRGGFLEFQAAYPSLCEDETRKCPSLTSLSQPCLSANNIGPTKILPFLYLGSQNDATNREILKDHDITYELNVSTNCPKPDFIMDHQFMRIPVNDNYSEKLLPHFNKAFHFLDKVRQANGCVLVHCLAGISRSPTIAIAYVMRHLRVSSEEAYRYVKSKRASISPNFNFLGQLLEYEKQLQSEFVKDGLSMVNTCFSNAPLVVNGHKRQCLTDVRSSNKLTLDLPSPNASSANSTSPKIGAGDLSPTSGIARLNFGDDMSHASPIENQQHQKDHAETFVASLGMSVTSSVTHREKRCVSELFLRKTSTIKELISRNPIQEMSSSCSSWDEQSSGLSDSASSEVFSSEEKCSSASSSADSGYEMMIDEKRVRLRRPLFPTKANCTNRITESGTREFTNTTQYSAAENISETSDTATRSSLTSDSSSTNKLALFSFPKSVISTRRTENKDSARVKSLNYNEPIKKEVVGGKVKEDGLYRAQSCPGILNYCCHSSSTSTAELAVAPLVVALTSAGSLRRRLKRHVEPCFTRGMERVVNWNRYSWGNVDFGKLERLLNSDSCPDFGRITSPDTSPRREKGVPSVIKVS